MAKLALGILLAGAIATPAAAQNYPSRPNTMIVPFAAGGATDTVALVTAETMGRILDQNIKGDIGRWRPLIQAAGQFAGGAQPISSHQEAF